MSKQHIRGLRRVKTQLDCLRPVFKAYALGYLTSTLPRLPSAIRIIIQSRLSLEQKYELLRKFWVGAIGLNRFPTSCALIVGGSTILPDIFVQVALWLRQLLPTKLARSTLELFAKRAVFICSFASAWLCFRLLNQDEGWTRKRANSIQTRMQMRPAWESPDQDLISLPKAPIRYAGKTIDFTLFALCRATDVVAISAWMRMRQSRLDPERVVPRLSKLACSLADPFVFSISSAIIMWSWFYSPERLPKTYNQWISRIAQIDSRLINALRMCRRGDLLYGRKESKDASLPSLCKELGLPEISGNPAVTVPIPCELYHCGAGKSCEIHAGSRFVKTFKLAIRLYLPLQMLGLLRRSSVDKNRLKRVLQDAARSSSFLAAFVALFYYAVCLARTRLGPNLISRNKITPQMWDSGLCVLAGCLACGWSILLEKANRRQEIAFFVAPRALATLLPRVYDKKYQTREQLTFAMSVAVVMSAMRQDGQKVRGVLGQIIQSVLR